MKVATAQEMREIDERAIQNYGIPGIVLMENAGLQVVEAIREKFPDLSQRNVAILAGKGNNGGDGLVVARQLQNRGIAVQVFLLARRDEVRGDARTNLEIALKIGVDIEEVVSPDHLHRIQEALHRKHLLVDAILGTGLTSPLRGFYREVISVVNASNIPVVAIDIPSGLSSDTGEVPGEHVKANLTVTFALPKRGQLLYPAAASVGDLVVADISIPPKVIEETDINVHLITEEMVQPILEPRDPSAHKGLFGHILVIGGSAGKTGAAAMASYAALRTGAGLVSLALPKSLSLAMETVFPEVMTVPLPETEEQTLDISALEPILELLPQMKVLVVGPGMTTHPRTSQLLKGVLRASQVPMVIDADGLNSLAGCLSLLRECPAPRILTPHPGEMSRLTGDSVSDIQRNRIEIAQRFSSSYGVLLVLKGARTLVSDTQGQVYINPTGNPGMATAGMGDVLSGMIAGLIAQDGGLLEGTTAAVYLHGMAGDLAAQKVGSLCLVASDLLSHLPQAIERVTHWRPGDTGRRKISNSTA